MRIVALLVALVWPALASAEGARAPGGEVDPLGVKGVYACSGGGAAEVSFRIAKFEDGKYQVEQRAGGVTVGLARYPWQLATATLYRERVTARAASKFRRLTGSLRELQELLPGQAIAADYAEAPLDGSSQPLEWRYDVRVGRRVASFGPSGLGEIEVVPVEETRTRYVDGRGQPLPLQRAAEGFERREVARIAFAPALGLALRIERKTADGQPLEACSLTRYERP